jgi:predicted ATPase with chaperone activity
MSCAQPVLTVAPSPAFEPPIPQTIEQTGLNQSLVEQLILKDLYFRGDMTGRDLATRLGLQFSLIEDIVENFKRQHLLDVKKSLGMGSISAWFSLSEAGRRAAQECLTTNQYTGRAPVPLEAYEAAVRAQRLKRGWITPESLAAAYQHMVVSPDIVSQVGPAVNSGKSFLIYGQPGNGKTFLAEALFRIESAAVYVPYAVECQGRIIQVFDPIYHQPIEDLESEDVVSAFSTEPAFDKRWVKCKRPFIVTGGELAIEMLDLSYNTNTRVYDAPLQMKANNGIYLIDDFGRQRVTPAEVLNRWIIPLERRIDYLNLQNGGKVTVPFEVFLVFSTNMQPDQLGDEAFLRRIQYKMFMRNPTVEEYVDIFERVCRDQNLHCPHERIMNFVRERYYKTKRPMRRCHPRDLIAHAADLMSFEDLPPELTTDVLARAWDSTFISDSMEDVVQYEDEALCA